MDKEEVIGALVGLISVGLIISGTVLAVFYVDATRCQRTKEATGLETKMVGGAFVHDCFINVDGKWIKEDNYGMGFTQK